MKRLLGLLLALALLPVFVSPTAAAASCSPYTGCAETRTTLMSPRIVPQGTRPVIRVRVTAAGNVKPVGKVTLAVKRVGGGYSWTKTVRVSREIARTVRPTRVNKLGKYVVTARFIPEADSIWSASSDRSVFRVVRKR